MEEKGGIIHIFFIFIGLACLCLGLFMYFTDENIELKEEPIYIYTNTENDNQDDDKDIINEIKLNTNEEKTITLKNKKEVKIKYEVNDSNMSLFKYNDKTSVEMSENESCSQYYIYNNSLLLYCTNKEEKVHLYLINENGDSKLVNEFKDFNRDIIIESISLKDGKLVVNATSVLEGTNIKVSDKSINYCNDEELNENSISRDSYATASFILQINNENLDIFYTNTIKSLDEFINENCKTVE